MKDRANAALCIGILAAAADGISHQITPRDPEATAGVLRDVARWIAEQYDLTDSLADWLDDEETGR